MSIIAAFHWQKSPTPGISTLIFDENSLNIYSRPKKFIFSKKLFSFNREAKKTINNFCKNIAKLSKLYQEKIIVEYKIVFLAKGVYWMTPSQESELILKSFLNAIKKLQKKHRNIILAPQLRRKLSGRPLRMFKRDLRKMALVSRKRHTGFEYHLWSIALHATSATYDKKLRDLRNKLIDKYWNEAT